MRLKQARCPECAKKGRDNHEDNLITYPDGHSHCFSCGYHTKTGVKEKMAAQAFPIQKMTPQLPEDFTFIIPSKPFEWLNKYLTFKQIKKYLIGWSETKQSIIFPYFIGKDELFAYQCRYFGENNAYPKWITYGKIHEFLHILTEDTRRSDTIVVVEDILSAICVAEEQDCLPLFGSHIPTILLTRLRNLGYNNIIIWLDPDKRKESFKFNMQARTFGFNSRVILTDKDPKDYTKEQIINELK